MTKNDRLFWKKEEVKIERAPITLSDDQKKEAKFLLDNASTRLKSSGKCIAK